jgi:hypothetical protein
MALRSRKLIAAPVLLCWFRLLGFLSVRHRSRWLPSTECDRWTGLRLADTSEHRYHRRSDRVDSQIIALQPRASRDLTRGALGSDRFTGSYRSAEVGTCRLARAASCM